MTTREDEVLDRLRTVVDPELGDTIVDLGMVRGVTVTGDKVRVEIALTIASCPLRNQIERDVQGHIEALDWVNQVEIEVAAMEAEERATVMARARWKARRTPLETAVPASARVLAVASGKGGVGKSSVTVNLAVALARRGPDRRASRRRHLGLLGPRLLGMEGDVEARGGRWSRSSNESGTASRGAVHGIPGRRGAGHHVARPGAQPGRPAVPRGRRLGRRSTTCYRLASGHR